MELFSTNINRLQQMLAGLFMPESPPVFIVGCGHSGTSLLLSILGSHSRIYPVPFESKIGFKSLKKYLYLWKFRQSTVANNKVRWVEKTPRHIYRIGKLVNLVPGSRVLIIMRDGRDVACSYKERFGDIEAGINAWIDAFTAGEKFINHPRVKTVRYEDLITDFENTVKGIFDFIGEAFEPQVLKFHDQPKYFYSERIEKPESLSGSSHDQYRNWQINQPLFDGRGKWRSLSDADKNKIKNGANDLLLKTGYIKSADW